MPCRAARARELLNQRKAAVFRRYPFTIILLNRKGGNSQLINIKIDPGSKTTGMVLVGQFKRERKVIWAANLYHRRSYIKRALDSRRSLRRGRRFRHTRYRKPRFMNRTRFQGWLPPALLSRLNNVVSWTKKLQLTTPISSISVEAVRFDTQKLQNPEISGVQYQQGTLYGYEVREYLLEKWGRTCAYCGKQDTRLEIDHIVPRSAGGSNRVSNLTICCRECNKKKSNRSLKYFLGDKKEVFYRVTRFSQRSFRDASAANSTRIAIGEALKSLGLDVEFGSGGQTKYNRCFQNYPKDHWIDAACVGVSGKKVSLLEIDVHLEIKAVGRGSRQMCRVDRFGFPRTLPKRQKRVDSFQTGDIIQATVPSGKKAGSYTGRVAIRITGNFNIKTLNQTVQGINVRFCKRLHQSDGYEYNPKKERHFILREKSRVPAPAIL